MRLLLVNDDGVTAANLLALAASLRSAGHDVWVVAPDREQSAMSHAITLHHPLRCRKHGDQVYGVSGTPVDSVYIGIHHLMEERPDYVISGINHGYNLGSDVFYSGTVAGAMEGALRGIRSIALSADRRCEPKAVAKLGAKIVEVLAEVSGWQLANVNIPDDRATRLVAAPLGRRDYADRVEVRKDPRGMPYYWIGGDLPGLAGDDNTDVSVAGTGLIPVTILRTSLCATEETLALTLPSGSIAS